MSEKVKEVALDEAHRIGSLSKSAAKSGAYLYPIRGLAYFVTHKELWKPLLARLVPTLTLGLGITAGMFLFTYIPQMAIMAFTSGPLAPVSAALLVLSESSALINILSKTFLIQDALIDTFDGVLMKRGATNLLSEGRQVRNGGAGDSIARLGKLIKRPFERYTPSAIIRYLMFLPLNFIPVVGTAVFLLAQGNRVGPTSHQRYFQLKRWNSQQQAKHVEEFRAAYTSFGVAATMLEMVPVAGIMFAYTNTVGAALWAADMESGKITPDGTAPRLRQQAQAAQ